MFLLDVHIPLYTCNIDIAILSVSLLHAGIMSKKLNLLSKFIHCQMIRVFSELITVTKFRLGHL